ncbi:MAG: transporter substrate-binding domain-containing protein [Planctomycetota bacterium]|nr:transporter substrate-binding domain-containing protein [Planctomycetota bacterium]
MKACVAAALAVFWVLVLAGCGGATGKGAGAPAAKEATEDTLARIKREGVLRWGADPSGGAPFVFFDPKDKNVEKVIGFEMDVMDKFAAHMGLTHEMVRSQWDTLLEAMQAQRTDMVINGIEINAERLQRYAFSKPYYVYEQMLVVRIEDKEKYGSLDGLKGKRLGVLSGAEAENVLKRAGWTRDNINTYEDSSLPYSDLELGRTDAVLQEQMIAEYYAGRNPKLYLVPKTFSPGRYGVAVRKEDTALLAEVDRILELMKQNGELAAIYKKWNIWNDRQKEVGVLEGPATATGN